MNRNRGRRRKNRNTKTRGWRGQPKNNDHTCSDENFIENLYDFVGKQDYKRLSDAIVGSQRFITILNTNDSDDVLVVIIKIVAKLFQSSKFDVNKNYIVRIILTPRFTKRINGFLTSLATDDRIKPKFLAMSNEILENIATILEMALILLPMTMVGLVHMVFNNIKVVLPVLKCKKSVIVKKSTEEYFRHIHKSIGNIKQQYENSDVAIDSDSSANNNQLVLLENFRKIDIVPSKTELLINKRPPLRKNIIDRSYSSIPEYLDIQFRLLREDFINPIREEIYEYRRRTNCRLSNIKIHNNVKFLERNIFRDLRVFKIQLHMSQRMEAIIYQGGRQKRFLNGSLLLFTNDNFETIIYGKVVGTRELRYGRVLVEVPIERGNPILLQNYTMIECVLFFEPYHQVLSVFQKLTDEHLPMEDYIIDIETDTLEPEYMEDVEYYHINEIRDLNPSQEKAHYAAMTKEFVIIQGPPGTGKTFMGTKIIEDILSYREIWHKHGPILIICLKNHALDQFLERLKKTTDRVGRLGGKNRLTELNKQFGPESVILDLLEDDLKYEKDYYENHGMFCKDNGKCQGCDYKSYRRFLGMLKSGNTLNYEGPFRHRIKQIPLEIKKWLKLKKALGQSFVGIKHAERDVKVVQKSIYELEKFKNQAILKTSFLYVDQHFDDRELACWLLCDDETIQRDWETASTTGLNLQNSDEISIITRLLTYCLAKTKKSSTYTLLSPKNLITLIQDMEEDIENDPNLYTEYRNFVTDKTDYLKMCLGTNFGPPEVNFNKYKDPFLIPCKNRWQIYNQWIENKKFVLTQELERRMDDYQEHYAAHNILKEQDNVTLLKQLDIVGMTTVCAAKMRSTLEVLKCPIVVVEEAAEVLESHIVAALTDSCQHLILLGDHKQLRPSTADYTIEKKYQLGISLFERMVINKIQCHTLNVQHRMRPEISKLLKPTFYKDLQDSESVKKYPDVSGVAKNLYFIDHRQPEEPCDDTSKMNRHEAKYLINLASYLLKNDYQPDEITILATYGGQVRILNEEKAKCTHPLVKEVHITPVDNFQGEENRIILLSLVRSNRANKIGFLAVDNRVCVALSRAREGFFIMGNMDLLCSASKIWKPIKACLESQKSIGKSLPLQCKNHKDFIKFASKPSDFDLGCNRQCKRDLECGHKCTRKCHGYDLDHSAFICEEPCTRLLCDNPDHKCLKPCFALCGPCTYLVKKKFPCNHTNVVKCSVDPNDSFCMTNIKVRVVRCQHIQTILCHQRKNCTVICTKKAEILLPCRHKQMIPCNENVKDFKCQQLLKLELHCGHYLVTKCYESKGDLRCREDCRAQLECGHLCKKKCHGDDLRHLKYQCEEPWPS